jgi:hypothetical protein
LTFTEQKPADNERDKVILERRKVNYYAQLSGLKFRHSLWQVMG